MHRREAMLEALSHLKEGDYIHTLSGVSGEVWFIDLGISPGDALIGVRINRTTRSPSWRHDLWRIPLDHAEMVRFGEAWLLGVNQLED